MARRKRVFVYEYASGGGDPAAACSRAELLMPGRLMRDALVTDLVAIDGVLATYATIPRIAGPCAPRARAVEAEPGERARDFVRRQAGDHDFVWVIAPESDGILADLRSAIADSQWIGCRPDAISIASSKRATAKHLRLQGIAATRDFVDPEGIVPTATRWVVKPDDGAGTSDTRVHATYAGACADLRAREARGASATLEAWEEGEALSLSVLCGNGCVDMLSVNRQHIETGGDGRVRYRGVSVNVRAHDARRPVLARLARDVVHAVPGFAGYVGIDVVLRSDGAPVVIEVNPRLTCAYVGLSASLGRNIAAEVLSRHAADALHAAR